MEYESHTFHVFQMKDTPEWWTGWCSTHVNMLGSRRTVF